MLKFVQVNAFTRSPFAGAPVAVLWSPDFDLDDEERARLAREIGQSSTAFVRDTGDGVVDVQFHSPWEPLSGCTSGLLAVAHALWTEGRRGHGEPVVVRTSEEEVTIKKRADHLCMTLPGILPRERDEISPSVEAIAGKCFVGGDDTTRIVELESEELVRRFAPGVQLPCRVLAVTAASVYPQRDFVSRVFVQTPVGVREDSVHGGAHRMLFPFWRDKVESETLRAEQISPRGGVLHAEWDGDEMIVSGQAVTTFKGLFTVRP